jgi:chromosome segregation ATPase
MQPPQRANANDTPGRDAGERPNLARLESSLKERRSELTRMMAEMRDLCQVGRNQALTELEELRHERLNLQEQLLERNQELAKLAEHARMVETRAKQTEEHYQRVLAEAEAAFADQGDEIGRLMAEFKHWAQGGGTARGRSVALSAPSTRKVGADLAPALAQAKELAAKQEQELERLRAELTERERVLRELQAQQYAARLATVNPAEIDKLRGELNRAQEELKTTRSQLAAAPAELEKLRAELNRARAEIQQAGTQTVLTVPPVEVTKLRGEIENLNKLVKEKDQALAGAVPAQDVEKLISELGKAKTELAKAQNQPTGPADVEQIRAELTIVQEELREKERELVEAKAAISAPHSKDNPRIAQYEAELIRYHRQLETDRQALNSSIEQLEKRNAELSESAKKSEQELSRERAQLSQLRDELHIDLAFEDLAFLARKHLAPIQPPKK